MAKPSLALIPSGYADDKVFSVLPSDGTGDFDFSRGTTATRVNKDGLIETVSNNVPRLNYPLIDGVVSGCPSLLLEPQRTNLITYSEDFSQTSFWNANSNVTILKNYKSPNGTLNASKIIPNTTNSQHSIKATGQLTNSRYNYTIYVKASGNSFFQIANQSTTDYVNFNLNNGTYFASNSNDEVSVDYFGDGWYKCNVYFATTFQGIYNVIIDNIGSTRLEGFVGNDVDGIYIWGAQAEQSSYPTSYIPTNGQSGGVTRSAETCNNSGDANTFNDSEGVLMAEISAFSNSGNGQIRINEQGVLNSVIMEFRDSGTTLRTYIFDGNATNQFFSETNINPNDNIKIALKYKKNDCSLYLNGFVKATDTIATMPSNLNSLSFDQGDGSNPFRGNTKQIQYFDTALTDIDLEQLTSWDSFRDMAIAQQYTII